MPKGSDLHASSRAKRCNRWSGRQLGLSLAAGSRGDTAFCDFRRTRSSPTSRPTSRATRWRRRGGRSGQLTPGQLTSDGCRRSECALLFAEAMHQVNPLSHPSNHRLPGLPRGREREVIGILPRLKGARAGNGADLLREDAASRLRRARDHRRRERASPSSSSPRF